MPARHNEPGERTSRNGNPLPPTAPLSRTAAADDLVGELALNDAAFRRRVGLI
jgi:hypothetical protein